MDKLENELLNYLKKYINNIDYDINSIKPIKLCYMDVVLLMNYVAKLENKIKDLENR